jgi:guanosine-diphosphatase
MSNGDFRKRPGLWSYLSFGVDNPRRRVSVSLPTRNSSLNGGYDKAQRRGGFKDAVMNHSQRSRYIKAGGILLFLIAIIFYLSPSDNRAGISKFIAGPYRTPDMEAS